MRKTVIAAAMSLSVVSLATIASADTLIMRDGTHIEGTMVSFAGRTITFRHVDGQTRRYPTSRVESLEFISTAITRARRATAGSKRRRGPSW